MTPHGLLVQSCIRLIMKPQRQYLYSLQHKNGPMKRPFHPRFLQTTTNNTAQGVCEQRFTPIPRNALVGQTVKTTMDNTSQTFREHNRSDPQQDRDGFTSHLLQQQFKGYKNEDPSPKQEKAPQLSVLH
jgi:hypothetical protein